MLKQIVLDFRSVTSQLGEHRPLMLAGEAEVVKRLNSNQLVKVLAKKRLPVVGGDDDSAVCRSNKLGGVNCG